MRSCRTAVFIALLAVAGAADNAAAQIGLSIAGGPTMPIGTLADAVETGYHAQLSAALSLPLLPVGVRVDGAFNQFPETGEHGNFRVLSGTANVILSVPSIGVIPYVIGGLGMYSSQFVEDEEAGHDHPGDGSTTNIGANLGAGVRIALPGLAVFAEGRVHNLFSEGEPTRFVPISLGIRF